MAWEFIKQVDDYQYGGGSGMVMMCEPYIKCISHLKSIKNYDEIISLTPDGQQPRKTSLINFL